ncbi:PepSY domain-containing protein [Methylopila musalis]|uniref:PepSY domain-containing protein n=1 Tax=Methylopila musalis TaxID=1134781 RepID=A0ABW3ZCE5_9HYPH
MRTMPAFAVAAALALTAAPAFADSIGPGWISIDQALQKARDAGYADISHIEADDGRWEVKGVKNSQTMEFDIDPKTGAISNERRDD